MCKPDFHTHLGSFLAQNYGKCVEYVHCLYTGTVKHTGHKHRSLKGDKMYHTWGQQHHELQV